MPSKQTKQKNSEIRQKGQLNIHLTFKKGVNDDEELALWRQIFDIVGIFNDDSLKGEMKNNI